MSEYDFEGINDSLTTDAQNAGANELRRIDPITTESPAVLPCGCSREMECFPHHATDGETPSIPPELGERFDLPGVGTVEVATVDGGTVVCETPFDGEEFVIPTARLTHL